MQKRTVRHYCDKYRITTFCVTLDGCRVGFGWSYGQKNVEKISKKRGFQISVGRAKTHGENFSSEQDARDRYNELKENTRLVGDMFPHHSRAHESILKSHFTPMECIFCGRKTLRDSELILVFCSGTCEKSFTEWLKAKCRIRE